jgi:ankyrin repeat protein
MSNNNQPNYAEIRKAQEFFGKAIEYCMNNDILKLQNLVTTFLKEHSQYSISDVFESFQSEGRTFLHISASSGHEPVFDYILKNCRNPSTVINAADKNGFTPLINATISESDSIISKLLTLKANVNAQNKDGAAAIHFASADGNISRLQLLLTHDANINLLSNTGNALHWAAGKGRLEVMKLLLDNNVDINAISPNSGLPAIFMAAVSKSDAGVVLLVQAGADVGFLVSKVKYTTII